MIEEQAFLAYAIYPKTGKEALCVVVVDAVADGQPGARFFCEEQTVYPLSMIRDWRRVGTTRKPE